MEKRRGEKNSALKRRKLRKGGRSTVPGTDGNALRKTQR